MHFFQCISLCVGDGLARHAVTYTECYIPDNVLTQFYSPDDEHWVAWNM